MFDEEDGVHFSKYVKHPAFWLAAALLLLVAIYGG